MKERKNETAEVRLLRRREIDENGCWLYRGTTVSNGYGWMSYNGRSEYAHRVAAVVFLEFDLESGLCVCHKCDTPRCFNPDHLYVGTMKDNMSEAAAKGRMVGKKLTEPQVAIIKFRLARGDTRKSIADEYGVSGTAVGQIARGQTWREVPPAASADVSTGRLES
jgi:hypothetical protein